MSASKLPLKGTTSKSRISSAGPVHMHAANITAATPVLPTAKAANTVRLIRVPAAQRRSPECQTAVSGAARVTYRKARSNSSGAPPCSRPSASGRKPWRPVARPSSTVNYTAPCATAWAGYLGGSGLSGDRGMSRRRRSRNISRRRRSGGQEGSIILDRLPSQAEAVQIRDILGIPKRVELSEGQLANLRAHAATNAFKPVLPASGD